MYKRHITPKLLAALADTPVVLLHGARQTGKSTLVQEISAKDHSARYLTFDDASMLTAASADPQGFLAGTEGALALDEIQRVPELFRAIKMEVDRNRRPGRFILTGSANVLMLPRLSDSLAGRMEILPLWPLSQGEMANHREGLIDRLFNGGLGRFDGDGGEWNGTAQRVLLGGYPEAHGRPSWERRRAWFDSYVLTTIQRDVRDLSQIDSLGALSNLLTFLAARTGSLVNHAEVSRSLSVPQTTLKRYLALLETAFLVRTLRAWSGNISRRLVKAPKVYLTDTGLATALLGVGDEGALRGPHLLGPMVENFVVAELWKQATWSRTAPGLYHFRSRAGEEVDIVMESAGGEVVGVEVKAAATVNASDFKGLHVLAEETGRRFRCGVVLHRGRETTPFARNLHAGPLTALWQA